MIKEFKGQERIFSNFWKPSDWFASTEIIKMKYTVEHRFQAWKAENAIEGFLILMADTPGKAKNLGKLCKMRKDWNNIKVSIMEMLVKEKFSDPWLKEQLLSTNSEELQEGNWWHDNFWGTCMCKKCGDKGENNLGKILMQLRNDLKGDL